jgi:GMP synthase-like glutamine amidotransferase
MNSVVVFRHAVSDGPGYFATFLERNDIPWRLVKLDEGEPVPTDPCAWSGVALLGGPMSVNDELPWIAPELDFVRQAVAAGVPVIGHCLGGQLMSKALGGVVLPNPVQEIGWGQVDVLQHKVAREWLGNLESFASFHWHGETFRALVNFKWVALHEG